MGNILDLKDYKNVKKAKLYIEHIKAILNVMDLSMRGLKTFEVYGPVHETLRTMVTQRRILESHLSKLTKFLKEREENG